MPPLSVRNKKLKKDIKDMMKESLPIYDITINEDGGVDMISLVDDPAIKVQWFKLSEQKRLAFVKDKKDKQLLYGPFLIPNMLIYRSDEKMGEYYVRFSAKEIEKIADRFNESLNNKNINFMHTDNPVDAYVSQNWIIEDDMDKSKKFGFDLPVGTWFGAVKVKDESFWSDQVKTDEVRGFSVEIKADLNLAFKNKKDDFMKKELKFESAMLDDGKTTVYWSGDLGEGAEIFIDEAMTQPAPDGVHLTQDGIIVKTTGGKVDVVIDTNKLDMSLAAYPWDQCIEDQMKQYGDEEIAKKVCGAIKAENMSSDEDLAVDPNTGKELPSQITPEEVSMMIDNRFGELMEEITRLKVMIEEKNGEMNDFKAQVNEKFSTTAAAKSIKEKEPINKVSEKFTEIEKRIREFAKVQTKN